MSVNKKLNEGGMYHAKKWKASGKGEDMFYDKLVPFMRSKIFPKLDEDDLMEFAEVAVKFFGDYL